MRHIVLRDTTLHGMEYGMLRDFEDEILRVTGGTVLEIPMTTYRRFANQRLARGTRFDQFRSLVPKTKLEVEAE